MTFAYFYRRTTGAPFAFPEQIKGDDDARRPTHDCFIELFIFSFIVSFRAFYLTYFAFVKG